MTNNKTLHNFIRGGVNLKLSILVIVALIAMMSVACKNKVTGMNEFTIESEEITAPSEPSQGTTITENTGVDQFSEYTYKSGVQGFKNTSIKVVYTASISDGKITIKVTKEDGITPYNNGRDFGQDQVYTATGTGSTYTLKAVNNAGYNLYIEGEQVLTTGGTATFDKSGYLTIVFNWGGTIKLSTQSK